MNIRRNAGITLMEIIIVVALIGITVPIVTILIKNAFQNSNTMSDKVEVQTSVTALMNKFEQTIKEATIPVATNSFVNNSITIYKPKGEVIFTFIPEDNTVTCEEKDSEGSIIDKTKYANIELIDVTLKSSGYGALVEITGGENSSEYSLSNVYYSRNTISSDIVAQDGKYLLTTVISDNEQNVIIETMEKSKNEEVILEVANAGFKEWVVASDNVTLTNNTDSRITFNMPAQDVVIIASFE